jgi:hypothetical protein
VEGPEHKQRGCPLPTHAPAVNLQLSQANPVSAPHRHLVGGLPYVTFRSVGARGVRFPRATPAG